MNRNAILTLLVLAVPFLLISCNPDGGGPSAEERAAKMSQGMSTHGASGPPANVPPSK